MSRLGLSTRVRTRVEVGLSAVVNDPFRDIVPAVRRWCAWQQWEKVAVSQPFPTFAFDPPLSCRATPLRVG
jgi:hypothetical protein